MTFARKPIAAGAPSAQIKKALTRDDGSELTGEWDEAQLTAMNCCIFNALRGDQLISIDFTSSDVTLRQSAGLVDAAYKRIDNPLKIDGAEAVTAAKTFAKTRPPPVDPCSLLSRTEVEALIGPLAGDAASHGTDECTNPVAPLNGVPRAYDLNVKWDGGYAQWRSTAFIGDLAGSAMRIGDGKPAAESEKLIEALVSADTWSHAGVVYNDFVIVKKDVLLKLDMRLLDHAAARNLLAAAARKF
jgi:hypothetical protein